MIIVTQSQLRNKDTEAIILLRNEIKASFNTNAIDYFTISAVAEILYNKFKHKKHDIIYHTTVSYFIKEADTARIDYNNRIKNLTNKFFNDNHIPLQVDDKVICNVNKNIYGKSHINAVIYRIIIDRNKTPRIMCSTDKNTYVYCNVEDIKKI